MTAPDAKPNADIAAFIGAFAAAWKAGDVEAIAESMGLPLMIAGGGGTTFVEDDAGLERWIGERLADWDARGVAMVAATVEAVENLPDDAARVTSRWHLAGDDGTTQLAFVAVDTIARDDGDWYYVVADTAGEDAARAGVS